MHAPSLLSRSVRIVPMFVSGFCVHPNVLGPWSIIVKWSRKYDQYLAFRAPPSFCVGSRRARRRSLGQLLLQLYLPCDPEHLLLAHVLSYLLERLWGDLLEFPPLFEGPFVLDAVS